jgi:hypothetical protein
MSKRNVYLLPEGISDLPELFESEGFKKFMEKKANKKISLWNFTLKNGIPADSEGHLYGIIGKEQEQTLVIQYLRGLQKKEKPKEA